MTNTHKGSQLTNSQVDEWISETVGPVDHQPSVPVDRQLYGPLTGFSEGTSKTSDDSSLGM